MPSPRPLSSAAPAPGPPAASLERPAPSRAPLLALVAAILVAFATILLS